MDSIPGKKRGFLNEDFRIFHLKDKKAPKVDYHYHEFDKLVLLISGKVDYYIEGTPYCMKPGDMISVPHGCIHMPVISPDEEYERYVIWTTPDFLSRYRRPEGDISLCFSKARSFDYMKTTGLKERLSFIEQLTAIQEAFSSEQYLSNLMTENLFVCFMISVCRFFIEGMHEHEESESDPLLEDITEYIEKNISGDLSVEHIASVFYVSRYHLMRSFKARKGFTLHQYITRRRILKSASLICSGVSAADAAAMCGYKDYSAFLRAFKSVFKVSPRSFSSSPSKKYIYNE